ncbi:hypothetical protein Gpo141_00013298 [Globisporangium polare]
MERWQVVVPWCKYLRGRLELEERDCGDHSLLRRPWWLLVTLPKTRRSASAGHLQRMREALELLALVAACDDKAWQQLLRDKCGVFFDTHERIVQHEPLKPRFIFVLDDHTKETIMWPLTLCSKLFFKLGEKTASQDYLEARAQVLATVRAMTGSATGDAAYEGAVRPIPFCLYFSPRAMDPMAFSAYLHSVLRVVQTLQSDRRREKLIAPGCKHLDDDEDNDGSIDNNEEESVTRAAARDFAAVAPFVLDAIQLNLADFELTEPVTHALAELFSLGVKISCLQLPLKASDFLDDDECPRQVLAKCFNAAVGGSQAYFSERASTDTSRVPRGHLHDTEAIVINDLSVDDRRFAALCSALVESTCMKELTLESAFLHDNPRARSLKWKWLAYALFSQESRSSVRKLVVSEASLRAEDIEAIASVLQSPFPAKELLDPLWSFDDQLREAVKDDDVHSVLLAKGTVICLEPVCSEAEWLSTSMVLHEDASFIVMNNNLESEWIEILVPGYGKCWVHRHFPHTTQTRLDDPGDWVLVSQCGKITSFTLAIDRVEESQGQIIASLFRLIGSELTSLTIQATRLHGDCLESILRSCPKLKSLSLKGAQIDTMDVFTNAYEKHQCRLTSITLKDFRIDVASFPQFAYRLANPNHPAALHLRELCLGSFDRHHPLDEDSVLTFLIMLERNTTLQYLELHIDTFLFDSYAPSIMRHHNRALPSSDAAQGMPSECKAAFLSIFRDDRGAQKLEKREREPEQALHAKYSRRAAIPRLDSNLLALVFAFAATSEPATRRVCLVEY